jgi:ferric-dicitrate binding protein FerR (iron transport regulator)
MSLQRQIDDLRARRAAEWFEILTGGDSGRNAEFVAWVAESSRHLEEMLKITALSQETREALRETAFDRNRLLERVAPGIASIADSTSPTADGAVQSRFKRTRRSIALAAAIAVVTLTAIWMQGGFSGQRPPQWENSERWSWPTVRSSI